MPVSRSAAMAVILPTDTYETIRTVVQHLGRQTVRDRLEIVIVAPRPASLGLVESELEGFAEVRVIPVESLDSWGAARAAGVRAAQAPIVFIGETHSYAHPDCAEALIDALGGPWAAVVPGFGNVNSVGPLSWSLFLLDYGQYWHTLPARETVTAPTHNVAYKRGGRLDATKGIDLLLRAFACLRTIAPTASLRIVGRGSERPMLENLAATLGLAQVVEFRGWVAPAEVEHELADAWALVVPSRWAEPLGLVALEAFARGVPVIASANGGLGEVVGHGTSGLVFANGDEAALGAHLAAVATCAAFVDHTLPENIVAETRTLHSESRHIDRMREIFREVAVAQGGGSVSRTA